MAAKKTIAVHDGLFHADELVAISLWLIAHPGEVFSIIRSRNAEVINDADIVMDVGGKYDVQTNRFDHHQNDCPSHEGTTIKFAACGLVWYAMKVRLANTYLEGASNDVRHEFVERIERELILGVDARDNGQITDSGIEPHQFTLGELVKSMNCVDVRSQEQEIRFNQMLDAVKAWLHVYFGNTAKAVLDKYIVLEAAAAAKDGILVLPTFIPVWKEVCLERHLPIKICLVNAGRDEYSITSALKTAGSMEPACPAPETLRGTMAADGKKLAECPIVFIHKAGFTGKIKANNLDEAMNAARAWING